MPDSIKCLLYVNKQHDRTLLFIKTLQHILHYPAQGEGGTVSRPKTKLVGWDKVFFVNIFIKDS